MSLIATQNLQ